MGNPRIDRRQFHQLTSAAFSGLAAGALVGCTSGGKQGGAPSSGKDGAESSRSVGGVLAAAEVHLCRGLNDCKGLGKTKDNSCRGQGVCATAKEHTCGGQNDCKGLGGCGEAVGANDCKGKGGCQTPLMEGAWETLRKKKEAEWAAKKLEAGSAPAAKKE